MRGVHTNEKVPLPSYEELELPPHAYTCPPPSEDSK